MPSLQTIPATPAFLLISLCALGFGVSRADPVAATQPAAVDWPMWGRSPSRNMVSPPQDAPLDWDIATGSNIKWTATLGSNTFASPVVADGVVYVGTNNENPRDPAYQEDAGVLMAFDADTGKFLWQRASKKLKTGRVNDWPELGLWSPVFVEAGRLWYCTNRAEVVCLDVSAGRRQVGEPHVLWSFDLIGALGVFPHKRTCTAIAAWKDYIYVITPNGVNATHQFVVAPDAPAIVCFNKNTGKVIWTDHSPGKNILHAQWSSVAIAEANGRTLVIAPLGDGWVYAYDAETGKIIWKFDANPKDAIYPITRNEIVATPAIVDNRMYIGTGQDYDRGEDTGDMYCVDITGQGDVSEELDPDPNHTPRTRQELCYPAHPPAKGRPNPNSKVVWHYASFDLNHDGKIDRSERMNRTLSMAVITPQGLCIIPDFSGFVHCLDAKTGEVYWTFDLEAETYGSPLYANGNIYIADEDGDVRIIKASKTPPKSQDVISHTLNGNIYTTPALADGTFYLATRDRLFAIKTGAR